ncbi:hypothetical protein [Streptomyces sp. NPDC008150]|uniref:hypothetical protein n=1 Tax=Streptomyces sp. NPDC008150 TaxID=3364816 RepID=UPI0036EAE474
MRAVAVLHSRSRALAVALLPAAAAVILLAGGATGHLVGGGWDAARWAVGAVAVLVLLVAGAVALVVARARPALSPTVPIAESSAPDLYRMVRDLADRLGVPAPSAIALTPDCDSWLEDRSHAAHRTARARAVPADRGRPGAADVTAPVLVIGSPFMWWMRVGELRAVLAPVVAGTGPSAHPDIAAARRFVRGLDAAVGVAASPARGPLARLVLAGVGRIARVLLRDCRVHAAEMERAVAAAGALRAQGVDYGLRIVAQEQVGLAYAGWDRLLTRVALPAWRMGRWPSRLDAGVVAALTELSRRDRLAEGFTSRLAERPACDLLEEPGLIDEATSLLAARLFHGGPAEAGPDWLPVDWQEYPDEVVDRTWRTDAARLHRVLDTLGVRRSPEATAAAPPADGPAGSPTLARVLDHLTVRERTAAEPAARPAPDGPAESATVTATAPGPGPESSAPAVAEPVGTTAPALFPPDEDDEVIGGTPRSAALAAVLSAELAREEASATPADPLPACAPAPGQGPDAVLWDDGTLPLFPLQPPRTGRELLADHVTAMVCCAAMDTAGAVPGLDWLDGPTLLIDGERAADLAPRVLSLIEDGDSVPLRAWLVEAGIRPEKPLRLV